MWARARQEEYDAYRKLTEAYTTGAGTEVILSRMRVHQEASKHLLKTEVAYTQMLKQQGELVTKGWARKQLLGYNSVMKPMLMQMAPTLAGRVNPDDPEAAREEIQEEVDRIFQAMDQHVIGGVNGADVLA